MKTYKDMPLPEELKQALWDMEFIKPTKIQSSVIPKALDNKDLMACAETGSGKTAAYAVPLVAKLIENPKGKALVLAPTRELALQIADFIRLLTVQSKELKIALLVGGADIRKQLKALTRNPQIIVATPGRLTDHLKRKSLSLKGTETLVLDEGDRMLDMGFAPQLDVILKFVPKQRQTSLFTATLPKKVEKLAEKYLNKPLKIAVGQTSVPVASIRQTVAQVTFKQKDERIIDELNSRQGSIIVFARTKHRTNILAKNLHSYGFSVDLLHGGRTQGQRNKAIRNFKKGKIRILCATDVAARGIDVPQVEHVINFDLPDMDEDYVHRIGRTARNGASGEALSFVTPQEHRAWFNLARKYQIKGVELENVSMSEKPSKKFGKKAGKSNGQKRKKKKMYSRTGNFKRGKRKTNGKGRGA